MRKNLFLFTIVALLLAIGCKKTELNPQPEGSTGQLTFNTSISQLTKAIHSGIEYADETFGMFVYALTDDKVWETDKSLTNPIMGGTDGTSAVEIALLNNEWRANDGNTYFWPSSSSTTASFFGYSPYRDAASTASPKAVIPGVKFTTANGVIFENYVNTVERAKVNDLMYTNAQLDKKYNSRDVVFGKLPVDFNHAMAQLVFTVKRFSAYPGVNIELQNITLKGLESKGTFSSVVAEGAKNWSIAEGNTLNYVVFNNTATPHNVIVTKTDVGDPHVMIPQDATSLTFDVTYKISGTGVATETFTKTIAFGVNLEMNKKTICNLVISLNDITFSPMIVEWDYQDSNYTDLPASSSTQKGINASLELLNQYKDELTKAGNTDQCFFTIDVPDGASGAIKLGFSSVDNFVEGDVISLHFSSTAAATSFVPMDGWSMSGSLAVATGGVISLVKTDFELPLITVNGRTLLVGKENNTNWYWSSAMSLPSNYYSKNLYGYNQIGNRNEVCRKTSLIGYHNNSANYYNSGWRVPTTEELTEIYNQKTQLEARGDLATFGSNVFWTSEELTATIAKAIIFSSGAILEKSKAETAYVRCVKDYPGLNVDQSSVIAYTDISKEVGFSVDDTYGGVVTVTYTGEESGKFAINSTGDKFIIPANMKPGNYVVTVAAGTTTRVIDLMVASTDNSMRFTIDTRKNTASDVNFMLPFLTDATRAYDLFVDWGDGYNTQYLRSNALTVANLTHAYLTAGVYTIGIVSSEKDFTKKQMQAINFYSYNTTNNNAKKLISMDTPLLNTANTSYANIFRGCTQLTTIAPGLFDKNINVTSFNYSFSQCNLLTSIPAGLFDKNTEVTDFGRLFEECHNLASIPAGLFDKNIKLLACNTIFYNCISLKEIPIGLFDKNINVNNFNWLFRGCSNITSVPAGLFAKNKKAIQFTSTFQDCTKLQLNPNIFCDEATEKATRFAGKTMNFTNCFNLGTSTFTGTQGTAPALWDYTMNSASVKTTCFTGQTATSLTNFASIPSAWK